MLNIASYNINKAIKNNFLSKPAYSSERGPNYSSPSLVLSFVAGLFTAPVNGVYYFRFNGWDARLSNVLRVKLYHNNKMITESYDVNDNVGYISLSNAFVLQLEKGDVVYMVLRLNSSIWDDSNNRTTFSGFLLFAL